MSEPHDVVKLLAARMESHPEEFGPKGDQRWLDYLHQMDGMLTEEERLMLRALRMQEIHEQVLDELMNGPDKRRQQELDRQYEQQLIMQKDQAARKHLIAQQQAAQQNAMGQYQNALSAGELSASLGQANQAAGSLSETINRLKQALGAKK